MEAETIKLLLIEDNSDDVHLITRKLQKSVNSRFEVTAANCLQQGLEYLSQNTPDLLLSDLGLPDSHGLDTVTKLMCEAPQIPLVVLSGFDDEATAIKAVKAGAQDYLVKGQFEGNQVERAIFYAIERSRLQRELEQHTQEISRVQTNLLKILEKNADAIIVAGNAKRILFANPAAESMLGRKRKDLLSQTFGFPLNKGKTTEIEIQHPYRETIVAEMSVVGIDWEGKHAFLASLRDITQRKKADMALRESEEKFSKAFRSSPEIIVITTIEDGIMLEANESFQRITGYTREEILNKKTSEYNIWVDPQDRNQMVKTLREKGTVSNEEYMFRTKSGDVRTFLFSAEIINISNTPCVLSVATDITERKITEEALRFSDTAFKSIHDGIIAMDKDFNVTFINEISERILGVKASDIIGKPIGDLITMVEEYPGQNEERINLLLEKGKNKEEQIYRTPRGDVWVDVHAQAIEKDGERDGWVSLIADIDERKKAEEALRFSDAAFKSIHESVIATDTSYVITHWNDISEQMFGIKAASAIGKKLLDVIEIFEEYPGENVKRFKTLETNGYYQEEQLHRTRHGEVWVEVSFQAIESDNRRYGWVILASAITQRKLAEEALKQSEEKYRELISTSIDAIISFDSNLRVVIWNQGAERIFGYMENEMLGQPVMKVVPDTYQEKMKNYFISLSNKLSGDFTNKIIDSVGLRKNGTEVPLELSISTKISGKNNIVTAILRDITERKEAEEAIKRAAQDWRTTFDSIKDMIAVIDKDHKIVRVNKNFARAFKTEPNKIIGKPCYKIHEMAVPRKDCPLKKTGKSKKTETTEYYEPNLGIYIEETVSPVIAENGEIIYFVHVSRDITERKEAEEKLRKIDAMKSEFLSNVSHELRTPLQSISGFTKLILEGKVPDTETQQEFLQIVDSETQHLGNLINSLLDMSRLESGRFQINKKLLPIRDTIVDSIKTFQSLAREKNISVSEEIPAQLPEMEVDGERMRQVVLNLLSNAIKYSDPGSNVGVKVAKQKGKLLFQVTDQGIGMSEESVKHLFERFYRSEDNLVRGGTGLGLYITKQIIEAHGGHIWAESKLNEGSTFSFTLPLNGKGGNGNGSHQENSNN